MTSRSVRMVSNLAGSVIGSSWQRRTSPVQDETARELASNGFCARSNEVTTTTAAAAGTRRHTGTYPAERRQVGVARAALAGWLGGCPQADGAILIASEFATNSVLHSASRHGGAFSLRAEVQPDCLRIEVEDRGGPWRDRPRDDGRPHGFDVVTAIAGAGNWAVDGDARGRVAWARLGW